eukprot:gene43268-biopygen34783
MTDRYAVLGNPIGHSKSPLIHSLFAQATGQDIDYTAIETPVNGFVDTVLRFRAQGGRGVNVTLPFKLQAYEIATEPSEQRQRDRQQQELDRIKPRRIARYRRQPQHAREKELPDDDV